MSHTGKQGRRAPGQKASLQELLPQGNTLFWVKTIVASYSKRLWQESAPEPQRQKRSKTGAAFPAGDLTGLFLPMEDNWGTFLIEWLNIGNYIIKKN
ncbi:hypothetical protein [Rufibacter immobilis]|uniref:hypothetical protein n=1 Tax=Rufibacter immobilis TaxID=1348778 RepID=UPI0035E5D8F4